MIFRLVDAITGRSLRDLRAADLDESIAYEQLYAAEVACFGFSIALDLAGDRYLERVTRDQRDAAARGIDRRSVTARLRGDTSRWHHELTAIAVGRRGEAGAAAEYERTPLLDMKDV